MPTATHRRPIALIFGNLVFNDIRPALAAPVAAPEIRAGKIEISRGGAETLRRGRMADPDKFDFSVFLRGSA